MSRRDQSRLGLTGISPSAKATTAANVFNKVINIAKPPLMTRFERTDQNTFIHRQPTRKPHTAPAGTGKFLAKRCALNRC